MLSREKVNQEEEELRNIISGLEDEKRKIFYNNVKDKIKDPDTYAVLNWFFITGLHHFYLKKWIRGLTNLIVLIVGIFLVFQPNYEFGIYLIVFILFVELWALFKSQIIVQDYNNKVYKRELIKLN